MKRMILAMSAALAAGYASGWVTTQFPFDGRTGRREAVCSQELRFDASWEQQGVRAEIYDGTELITNGIKGVCHWMPTTCSHTLSLKIYGEDVNLLSTETAQIGNGVHAPSISKPAVEATSGEAGSTAETTCSRCGEVLQAAEVIPALGYIRDVKARQLWPHRVVTIDFTVADDVSTVADESDLIAVGVTADGSVYSAVSLFGDLTLTPGKHRIAWDMGADGIEINASSTAFTNSVFYIATENPLVAATSEAVSVNTSTAVQDGMSLGGEIEIAYSPLGGDVAKVYIDGALVLSSTESGTFNWQPKTTGMHTLLHVAGSDSWQRTVNVTGLVYAITQPGGVGELAGYKGDVGTEGGTGDITVVCDEQITWNAMANDDWISISPTVGEGDGVVTYTVAPWNEFTARNGTITAAGCTFTIHQTGRSPRVGLQLILW